MANYLVEGDLIIRVKVLVTADNPDDAVRRAEAGAFQVYEKKKKMFIHSDEQGKVSRWLDEELEEPEIVETPGKNPGVLGLYNLNPSAN